MKAFTGGFEMVGNMVIGEIEQNTNTRFENFNDFETYDKYIHVGYDSADVIFIECLFKLNTPQFKKVNRLQNGKGSDFKQDIVGNTSNNC